MRPVRLHDTRSGRVEALEPRDGHVGIYACGPTVYGRIHIGNARPFVVFSLFKRFLEHEGLRATLVANVTDINDKIYAAARERGVPSADLAEEMTAAYLADTERLGLGRPDHEPRATEYVGEIVELIQALLDRDAAYVDEAGDVWFAVRADPAYGELSHRAVDDMDQGEGLEGADRKRDPLDFALWKARKEGEDTSWPAPWGEGRPGWHIECSAMAEKLLGLEFDVHGGGSDLVFPHHENEAAQTRRGRGRDLARLWMHNGMLELRAGEKMAKSVGNFTPLHEALDAWGPETLLLFFAGGHYRQPLAWGEESLQQAAAGVRRIREAGRRVEPGPSPPELAPLRDAFFDALADDFNTPKALPSLWAWIDAAFAGSEPIGDADLREMLGVLGLEALLEFRTAPGEVVELAVKRQTARANRDFDASDRLRDQIAERGWDVRDTPGGFELTQRE
jgi:cysteinyl-tRNA synthetase